MDAGIPADTGAFVLELASGLPPGRARYAIERFVPLKLDRAPQAATPAGDEESPRAPNDVLWRRPGSGWISAPVETTFVRSSLRTHASVPAPPFVQWSVSLEREVHVVVKLEAPGGQAIATLADTTIGKGLLDVLWSEAAPVPDSARTEVVQVNFIEDGQVRLRQRLLSLATATFGNYPP